MFVIAPYLSTSLGDFWSSAVFLPFWGPGLPGNLVGQEAHSEASDRHRKIRPGTQGQTNQIRC